MDINHIEIGLLKGYSNNTRTHSEEQIQQIAGSIREFGFTNPVLIDGNQRIIAGHGRLAAARVLGLDSIPCISLDHLNDTQVRALVIADNQIAMNAGWDEGLLATELDRLQGDGFDLDLLGFEADDLEELLQSALPEVEGLTDEDDVPEAPEEPVTVEGDIWVLGDHRVMCGDSTSIDAVEKLMDGEKADMVFTDPPYGNGSSGKYGRGQLGVRTIANDENFDVVRDFINLNVASVYLFFLQWRTFKEAMETLEENNLTLKTIAVWDKKNAGLNGAGGMSEQWEAILIAGDVKYSKFGGNVFSVSREQKRRIDSPHPHQKPIILLAELLEYFVGYDLLLDPFLGSGSTLIACEKTNRKCYGMELDPKYCDVIIQRWQDYTGRQAIHAESGELWQSV